MKKEKIFFKNLEIRTNENDGKRTVIGIIPYDSKSVPMYGITEIISRTAFNKTLADKSNVYALFDHDDSKVLGSTRSGTLQLENSDDGLICKCDLPNTSAGNDAWELIQRGDSKNLSFGFTPVKADNKGNIRTLREVNLAEVSFCVPFPCYEETNSEAIKRNKKMKLMTRNIDVESLSILLEKEELTEEEIGQVKELIDLLNKKLPEQKEEEAVKEEQERESTPEEKDTSEADSITQEELELIETAIELELLDIDEIESEVKEKQEE